MMYLVTFCDAELTHHSVSVLFLVERVLHATAWLSHHFQGGFIQFSSRWQIIHPLEHPGDKTDVCKPIW